PAERIERSWFLGQHADQRRDRVEPRTAVGVAVGARGAIQNRTYDFQGAVDGRRTRALAKAVFEERFQCCVVNLLRLEVSDVARKQLDVPLDYIDAALATRLSHVARGAVGEGRTRVCLAFL